MSSIKEKERYKEQQEKFQAVLSALLKDEDNKYCVDCDAKGPRWAAWNIGVFLCIRCAGIHRNLGVHISKVKSVNLDSWTPEQVAMMQEMGNSRARAVYEANIPDGFRRPQTDSSLEAFIRSKYEQKKYIAREWIPPQPRVPKEWLEDPKAEKKRARAKQASSTIQLTNVPKTTNKPVSPAEETAKPAHAQKVEVKAPAANSASSDLLGLEAAAPVQPSGGNELLDLFVAPQSGQAPANTAPAPAAGSDLMNGATDGGLFGEEKGEEKKTSAKDSIMALYGGGGGGGGVSQPQMYGVPGGVYMPQAQQQMYPGMTGQQQGMMGPQGMMGAQGMRPQQGMVGAQQGMVGQQQGMVGQQHGMVGQQQGMMGTQQGMMGMMGQQGMMGQPQGMMGQPQGMMGNQGMNGAQMGMYNGQMMSGNPGMYAPQQMQQLQFQQMQQQMTNLKLNGAQMGTMPQQTTSGASGWGNTGQGQTLATNLWQ